MAKGGYRGKIIRVDLTLGSITIEDSPEDTVLKKYIGNFGLGLWYLMKMMPVGARGLDPENPMIFLNGPLAATRAPSATNCTLTTFNADTGFTAGRSHTHGWFGPFLAKAGYDGIIFTGSSSQWVYLWIDDDKIELRNAENLLGIDTHDTETLIKKELGVNTSHGAKDGASVAAIGPAGENMVLGASIMNDKNHGFCHGSVGAVMGSKRLKAIAVRGTGEIQVFDEKKLRPIAKEWTKRALEPGGGFGSVIKNAGSPTGYSFGGMDMILGLSAKNWTANSLPGFGIGMAEHHKITPRPCYRCSIGCCYDVEIQKGRFKGYTATLSGGGENMEGAASILGAGAQDSGEILYLTDLDDRLGLETSTVGCAMSVAFEAFEKGLLTTEHTDGLELRWGDAEVIEKLVRRIANREGNFAQMLADGPKAAAERVGLPDAGVHIKGAGMNLHDWRRAWGVLLAVIVSGGTSWHGGAADCWCQEPDAGYPEMTDPLNPRGKGKEVAETSKLKFWHDTYGCCWFASWGVKGILKLTADSISAVTGWDDFTSQNAIDVGHRSLTLERIFNMRHGLTAEDDINISPKITEPAPADAGPAAGKSIKPYLEGWVRDYYEHLGWDRKTGKPLRATLKKLDMEEFIPMVWG